MAFIWGINKSFAIEPDKQQIYIPAQPLTEALIQFSSIYGRVVIGLPDVLKKYQSSEVRGHHSPFEALTLLLKKTHLIVHSNQKNGFVVLEPERQWRSEKNAILDGVEGYDEEVLITGLARKHRLLYSGVSVNTMAAEQIEKNNIDSAGALTLSIPNLYVLTSDSGDSNVALRGVKNYGNVGQSTTPIAFYYQDYYLQPRTINSFSFFDLQEIVVAKGPQVTGKGRTATSGAIYVSSADPVLNQSSAMLSAKYGNYGRESYTSVINKSILDNWAVRIAGNFERHDGFTDIVQDYSSLVESYPKGEPYSYPSIPLETRGADQRAMGNYNSSELNAWRLSSLFNLTDDMKLVFKYESHNEKSGITPLLDPLVVESGERVIATFIRPEFNKSVDLLTANLHTEFKSFNFDYRFGVLKSDLSQQRSSDFQRSYSQEIAYTPSETLKSYSHTFELYDDSSTSRFNWRLGGYSERNKKSSYRFTDTIAYSDEGLIENLSTVFFDEPDFNDRLADIFGRVNYTNKKWWVSGGVRYSYYITAANDYVVAVCDVPYVSYIGEASLNGNRPQDIYFSQNLLDGEHTNGTDEGIGDDQQCYAFSTLDDTLSFELFSLDFAVEYALFSKHNVGIRLSQAERPGLVQSGGNVDSEVINGLELKWYGSFEKLNYEVAFFDNVINGMQAVGYRYADLDGDGVSSDFLFPDTQNIAKTNISGVEVVVGYSDPFGGQLSLGLNYLNAKIDDYELADNVFNDVHPWNPLAEGENAKTLSLRNLSGNTLPHAPKWSGSLNYSIEFETDLGSIAPSLSIKYIDEYYLDIFNRDDVSFSEDERQVNVENLSLQKKFITTDFFLAWKTPIEGIDLDFYIQNLTDEKVRNFSSERFYSHSGFASIYSSPREYGLKITLSI